ncbi:hydrolase [Gemmobacter nanjingensis]|uniref:Hydrolase n=1 Tax=Gemmobacter nanjingensis TaxID=488454 RepID=A0ABQ3F7I5_9RHOB|nr:alpha/beta hydrolase [Gemmobacter nanjingensis]GHC11838.1 hydrolase [Gemmobacter nanjingensis]
MPETIAGHPTAYRHWGQGGRPALALHCSLAHAGAWSGVATGLPELSLTAPDLPGHGRSADLPPGGDLHGLATAIAAELAERADGPVDLFGHSFGATVALRLTVERPDLVRRLVLIEPVLFAIVRGTPEFDDFARVYMAVDAQMDGDPFAAAALFHKHWGVGDFGSLPEMQRRYMADRMPLVRAQNPVLLEDRPGLTAPGRLEAINVPVLLLEGAESPAVIGAIHGALAARIPGARRVSVPGAAHMVPITHSAAVVAAIRG